MQSATPIAVSVIVEITCATSTPSSKEYNSMFMHWNFAYFASINEAFQLVKYKWSLPAAITAPVP